MFQNWKYNLLHGWHFMRLFRLGLAIMVLFEAWKSSELLYALLGLVLLAQALLNVGCCGTAGCGVWGSEKLSGENADAMNKVNFEEIK